MSNKKIPFGKNKKEQKPAFKRTNVQPPSDKKDLKEPLIKAAQAAASEIEALGVNGLPLRPYLDDIWAAINGHSTDITSIQTAITAIQSDILDIQTNCCSGGGGSPNLDGGHSDSVYTAQFIDGGSA